MAERGGTLSKTNKVISKHIDMGDWTRVEEEWRVEIRGWVARREHEGCKHGTSALPGGDQWIPHGGGDQQIPHGGGDQWIPCGGDQWIPMVVGTSRSPMVVGTSRSPMVVGTSGSLSMVCMDTQAS